MAHVKHVLSKYGLLEIEGKFLEDKLEKDKIKVLTQDDLWNLLCSVKQIRDELWKTCMRNKSKRDEYMLERWHQLTVAEFYLRFVRDLLTEEDIQQVMYKYNKQTEEV